MITVLIATDDIFKQEEMASCVLRRAETTVSLLCPRDSTEALALANDPKKHHIDMFIISVKLHPIGGRKLVEKIRTVTAYQETPVLFLTDMSYDLVGFSYLSTKRGHKTHNYISLPLDRIDAQGKIGMYLEDIIARQLDHDKKHRAFLLDHSTGTAVLKPSDIYFCEVQDKTSTLHTKKGLYHLKRKGLTDTTALIHAESFVRCHKSFALNTDLLIKLERLDKRSWNAFFQGTQEVCPVSLTYHQQIQQRLLPAGY